VLQFLPPQLKYNMPSKSWSFIWTLKIAFEREDKEDCEAWNMCREVQGLQDRYTVVPAEYICCCPSTHWAGTNYNGQGGIRRRFATSPGSFYAHVGLTPRSHLGEEFQCLPSVLVSRSGLLTRPRQARILVQPQNPTCYLLCRGDTGFDKAI